MSNNSKSIQIAEEIHKFLKVLHEKEFDNFEIEAALCLATCMVGKKVGVDLPTLISMISNLWNNLEESKPSVKKEDNLYIVNFEIEA
jgi:hypothetical protein